MELVRTAHALERRPRYLVSIVRPVRRLKNTFRPHRWCRTARPDLGEQWPSRPMAAAAENGVLAQDAVPARRRVRDGCRAKRL
jgi:hypothetical protein